MFSLEICRSQSFLKRLKEVSYMNSQCLFLDNVIYLPGKREIVAEFSNANEKFTQRFNFFPSMIVAHSSEKILHQIIALYDSKKFISEKLFGKVLSKNEGKPSEKVGNNIFKITGATFVDLQKLHTLILSSLKISPLLIEPERQFLIQKNWSYFDSFTLQNNELFKEDKKIFPQIQNELFTKQLNDFSSDLLKDSPQTGKELIQKIAFSNILKIPFTKVSLSEKFLLDSFFENVFFANNFTLNPSFEKALIDARTPNGNFSELTEIDFSPVFSDILTNSFYNISFDSINCGCCKPVASNAQNVLPTSFAEVEFLSDGLYFESSNIDWSNDYHQQHAFKQERLKRKTEWFLKFFPVGPFYRNQKQLIPLHDAIKLVEEQKATISFVNFSWFCAKKEGFVSKELKQLNKQIVVLNKLISQKALDFSKQFNLFSSNESEKDPEFVYFNSLKNALQSVYYLSPYFLSDNSSKFFCSEIASNIKCLQLLTLNKFSQFVEEKGFRNIYSNSQKAFVKTDSALELVEEFSEKQQLPQPEIVKKHKVLAFH